jgi:phosphoglycerol transferase MdoB-like AlkP superfamily enzyme
MKDRWAKFSEISGFSGRGKILFVRKIILTLIVLVTMGVVATHASTFLRNYVVDRLEEHEYKVETIAGNQEVEQKFVAEKSYLWKLGVRLYTLDKTKLKGSVQAEIKDSDGKSVAKLSIPCTETHFTKYDDFTEFEFNTNLTKGDTYTLVVSTVGSSKNDDIGVYVGKMADGQSDYLKGATIKGKEKSGYDVRVRYVYQFLPVISVAFMAIMLIAALIFIWLPMDYFNQKWQRKKFFPNTSLNRLWGWLFVIATPFTCHLIMMRYYNYGLKAILIQASKVPLVVLLNLVIYCLVMWAFYVITNRTTIASSLTVIVFSVFALGNYYVYNFRGTPISFQDVYSISTAKEVAGNYTLTLDLAIVYALVFGVTFVTMALSLRMERGFTWKKRLVGVLACAVALGGFYHLLFNTTFLKDHDIYVKTWHPQGYYKRRGTALSFVITWTYNTIEKPKGYSVSKVEKVAKLYESDSADSSASTSQKSPNIIVIMNESLSDLNVDGKIKTSEDYMPYLHSLKKNTIKGNCHMSVFGANTANSEFEFLTGASMAYLPARSVAYNSLVRTALPNFTTTLKQQNYGFNKALHPYYGSGWNRETVYPLLGFEDFISMEDISESKLDFIRAKYTSDQSDYKLVEEYYEKYRKSNSSQPFYLFNVTMQNHGGYDASKQGGIASKVKITDSKLQDDQAELYLNLVKKSDEAFQSLTEYFENVAEPTVIVMFGDHQPAIEDSFWTSLYNGKSVENTSRQTQANRYVTPFVIWANYDIGSEQNVEISANMLGAYTLDKIGAKMTGFQKYLVDMHKKIQFVAGEYYMGDDKKLRLLTEKSKYSKKLTEYQMLEYNLIADTKNTVSSFFNLKGAK